MRDGDPVTGWRIDRRTFLKALGLGGVGLVGGGALGSRLAPLVLPAAAQTSPIDDLALQLRFDPERIFRFVTDEIHYHPYAGMLRGAEGTRLARAGNSADQAALLAALLEASGVQVRFVEGQLEEAQAERLILASTLDIEAQSRRTLDALVEARPDGSLPATPQLDGETEARISEAIASADQVMSWVRGQVLDTVDLLESALASAELSIAQPAGLPELERRRHIWLQMASGPAWIDLDPSAGGAIGETVTTPVATMDVLPDELRHRLDFRVIGETVEGGQLVEETLLEASDFADLLVGVPVGFLNIEHDGLRALGVNITSSLSGGTTYLPCLIAGEGVIVGPGAIRFEGSSAPVDDVFAPSSGDPAGHLEGEPTAECLEITVSSPGAEPVIVRRDVFDRIGPAARLDGSGLATLEPAELVSLEPGAPPDFLPAQTTHWLSVEGSIVPASRIERLSGDPEAAGHLSTPAQVFHATQAAGTAALAADIGGQWFPDAPNIVSLTVTQELLDGQLAMRPILDIWLRGMGRAFTPATTPPGSPLAGGVLGHVTERILAGDHRVAADPATHRPSVGAVFDTARSEGVPFRTLLGPDDVADLALPPDTKARLVVALEAGHVIVIPERPVTIGGLERTGWWRIDPVSGRTADEMDDGRGSVMGDVGLQVWNLVKASPAFHRLGTCVALTVIGVASAWTGVGGLYLAATGGDALGSAIVALAGGLGAGAGGLGFYVFCS